jgi:Class II Aldolase and Adducin N-terminal domain/ARD/ARD' family
MRNSYYVDSPVENATTYILNQLGFSLASKDTLTGCDVGIIQWTSNELAQEHKNGNASVLKFLNGSCSIELRDTSNSWIHVDLEEGDVVNIPANVYHRILFDGVSRYEVVCDKNVFVSYTLRFAEDKDSIEVQKYHEYRELVCELCRQFFIAGWVTGTGGSISIKYGNRIYMTPSGVQKERIKPEELFVLDVAGNVLSVPRRKPDFISPKLSDCAPLFLHAYQIRNAGNYLSISDW